MPPTERYLVTPQTSEQISREAAVENAESDSVRELELKRARYYMTPTGLSILGYFFVALVALVAMNITTIIHGLNQTLQVDISVAQGMQSQIQYYANNQLVSLTTIVLFWGMVGLGAYTLYWLVMAFFTAARNELIVETAFSNRGHFWEKIKVPLIKLTFLGCLLGLIMLCLRILVPALGVMFGQGIANIFGGSYLIALIQCIGSVLVAMFILYLFTTLIKIFRHADGIF